MSLLSVLFKINIETIGIFGRRILQINVKGINVELGYIPIVSYLKLKGMNNWDSLTDEPYSIHKLTNPKKVFLLSFINLIFLTIGAIILLSNIGFEFLDIFYKSTFFINSISDNGQFWTAIIDSPLLLFGFILFVTGLLNIQQLSFFVFRNYQILNLLFYILCLMVLISPLRIIIDSITLASLTEFIVTSFIGGIILFFINLYVASIVADIQYYNSKKF